MLLLQPIGYISEKEDTEFYLSLQKSLFFKFHSFVLKDKEYLRWTIKKKQPTTLNIIVIILCHNTFVSYNSAKLSIMHFKVWEHGTHVLGEQSDLHIVARKYFFKKENL